jgi:hypothetical protein
MASRNWIWSERSAMSRSILRLVSLKASASTDISSSSSASCSCWSRSRCSSWSSNVLENVKNELKSLRKTLWVIKEIRTHKLLNVIFDNFDTTHTHTSHLHGFYYKGLCSDLPLTVTSFINDPFVLSNFGVRVSHLLTASSLSCHDRSLFLNCSVFCLSKAFSIENRSDLTRLSSAWI